jgi:hypothetical protein
MPKGRSSAAELVANSNPEVPMAEAEPLSKPQEGSDANNPQEGSPSQMTERPLVAEELGASRRNPSTTPLWLLVAITAASASYFIWQDYQRNKPPDPFEELQRVMQQHRRDEATRRALEGK